MELQDTVLPGLGNPDEQQRSPKRQRLSPELTLEPRVNSSKLMAEDREATSQEVTARLSSASSPPIKPEPVQLPGLGAVYVDSENVAADATTDRRLGTPMEENLVEENIEADEKGATRVKNEDIYAEHEAEVGSAKRVKQELFNQEIASGSPSIPDTDPQRHRQALNDIADTRSDRDGIERNNLAVENHKVVDMQLDGEKQLTNSSETFLEASNGVKSAILPNVEDGEIAVSKSTVAPTLANLNPHLDAIEASINDEGAAEWEVDSSPIQSSESTTSSDETTSEDSDGDEDEDEDEDDEEGEGRYALLDPEEQARILMEDGGSDDEGGNKKSGAATGNGLRTTNEKPEEVVPKPNITVTPDMKIEELGTVEFAVEHTVVIKAKISGEYKVLDAGSLLCLEDRSVVGVVADTIGRTQQPLYTVRFTNDAEIAEAGVSDIGKIVYYVEQHSTFVFTQPLRGTKGSDASNFHDEEVGDDEIEFSDDEKEAEYRRQMKQQRQQKRQSYLGEPAEASRGKIGRRGTGRSNLSREVFQNGHAASGEINYDDVDMGNEDGYTPLQRPSDFQDMIKGREAPIEGYPLPPRPPSSEGPVYNPDRPRGRGDRFNRGGRSRGFSDRGRPRGHGSYQSDRKPPFPHYRSNAQQSSMGPPPAVPPTPQSYQNHHGPPPNTWHPPPQFAFSQNQPHPPLSAYDTSQYHPYQPPNAPSLPPQSPGFSPFSPSPISPLPSQQFGTFPFPIQAPQQPQHQHYSPQQQRQQIRQQMPQMPPPGSHINPAFFNAFRQGQGQQQQQQQMPQNAPYGGSGNETAFRQVQDTLEALRRAQGGPG